MSDDAQNKPSRTRSRTVEWSDPFETARIAAGMSGLEFLQALARGEIPPPPIGSLMNFIAAEVEQGRVVFTAVPGEYHYNPVGAIHGGFAATLLDTAMACSILSTLPAGVGSTTVELHINYIRPLALESGKLFCTGEIIHVGRTMATAQGRLTDASGKLYAHGTTTCMILRLEGRT